MATANNPRVVSLQAGGDLSAGQWLLVKVGATANQVVIASAGSDAIGVLWEPAGAAGRAVAVANSGVLTAWAGGSIAIGDKLASDANGKLVKATSGATVVGTSLTAVTSGVMCRFLWAKQGVLA